VKRRHAGGASATPRGLPVPQDLLSHKKATGPAAETGERAQAFRGAGFARGNAALHRASRCVVFARAAFA